MSSFIFTGVSGSSTKHKYYVDTYADLASLSADVGDIAYVYTTTGLLLFGTRKLKGAWDLTSTGWEYSSADIQAQVATNIASIESNDSDITDLQTEQLTQNNRLDSLENTTLSLNDLTDVTTTDVIPEAGWQLKFDGTEYKPSMVKHLINNSLLSTTNTLVSHIDEDVSFQRIGTYIFTVSFAWSNSINWNGSKFYLNIGGVNVSNISNGELLNMPMTNSNNEGDGRGTKYKSTCSMTFEKSIASIGNQNIQLNLESNNQNGTTSIWDAVIKIEEKF